MLDLYASVQEDQTRHDNQASADFAINSEIELKREWQASYDAKMDQAQRAFKQFSTPELDKLIDETGLGNHPEFIKTLSLIHI